jgi:tRNA(Ile)-lysidine synthase
MLNKTAKFISDNNLFRAGETVIVAVSGGADSIALLDILANLKDMKLTLVVAHINHMLRGEESEADAAFVSELSKSYRLPVELHSVDVRELSRTEKLSLEMGGRLARYAWFNDVATRYGATSIALAHHADDQAETVLMRLLRGSGTTGLAGIPLQSADRYVRPLLNCTRAEIEAYLHLKKISYRTDRTNTDLNFLRNRIRHELLPYLQTFNPLIHGRLANTAEILAADESLLDDITEKAFSRLATVSPDEVVINLPDSRNEPRGLRLRLYRKAILAAKGNLAHINFRNLLDIDALIFSDKANSGVDLPGGIRVNKCYQQLAFGPADYYRRGAGIELNIGGPGIFPLPEGKALSISITSPPENDNNIPVTSAYFDLSAVPFPWLVRTFKPGDRIIPSGMTGSKKIKDLFIDLKIPLHARRRIPLLFSNDKLFWICGVRVAAGTAANASSDTVVRVDILREIP